MPVWQQFFDKHRVDGVEVLSVAMDAQGADRARPYVEKAGATFATVVDVGNLLGQLYGFKAIPNGFLIDEQGVVQYKRLGGFDIRRAETARTVEQWASGPGLDESTDKTETTLGSVHSQANAHFVEGLKLYRQGQIQGAIAAWREGVELEPDNYIIRKQIWAVENPDRFYAGDIDFEWQKRQMSQGL